MSYLVCRVHYMAPMSRVRFGGYELLERIGAGGMAEVFRARMRGQQGFSKLVAIKRIRERYAADPMFVGMFIDEAKISVQLDHSNIAKIFDLGKVKNQYFIAMEHIHGRDLKTIFNHSSRSRGPLPIAEACHIAIKMCEGLDYAHSRRDVGGQRLGLVHRDISLQNVLVSFDGQVKVIDFGIAKAMGRTTKTQAGMVKGKLAYMSPEQMRGLPVDARSDIFAAGIVLYELLAGRRLFLSDSTRETVMRIRSGKIVPIRTYNQRVPAALEAIVLKALSLHPQDRFQSAGELAEAIQRFAYYRGYTCTTGRLAAWMRGEFHKQYADETARLDAFSLIEPTPAPAPLPLDRPALIGTRLEATLVGWAPARNRTGQRASVSA